MMMIPRRATIGTSSALVAVGLLLSGLAHAEAQSRARSVSPPPESVVWDSPSADARGSMPLGNGDIALNAWVEPGGDLLFYIGKTDS